MTLTTHEPLTVTLGSSGVTPEDVVAVARQDAQVTISQDALAAVASAWYLNGSSCAAARNIRSRQSQKSPPSP